MPCYTPLKGWRGENGRLYTKRRPYDGEPLTLPCGNCIGCKIDRTRSWAVRCTHEAQMHAENSYITLTYSPDHLPADGSVNVKHFQQFMKDFRKKIYPIKIRFFSCGEYGEKNSRPHYHACIFGYQFRDLKFYKKLNGYPLYTSDTLEKIWGKGFCTIGEVTWQSAAYVARYIMKKINGNAADEHYANKETGELLTPEYTTMSLRPGLGKTFYDKYKSDIYPSDEIIIIGKGGVKTYSPPRYYDKLLERENPELLEHLKTQREKNAALRAADNTPERLAVRKKIKERQLNKLKRPMEETEC